MKSLEQTLNHVEELVKSAQWEPAQNELRTLLNRKDIPRNLCLRFANLCRRSDIPETGLTALRPYVHPTGRKRSSDATEAEKNEYAASLVRIGASQEAHNLLSNLPSHSSTDVIHTLASIHVKQWNYPAAIPLFLEYIGREDLTSYTRQIGSLNLALCLTFEEKLDHAESIVRGVLDSKEAEKHPLVKANALRIFGLVEYQRSNFKSSMAFFEKAFETFPVSNGLDRYLVQKWMAIVKYALERNVENQANLEKLRKQAFELEHWESVRDLDYHKAVQDQDEAKLVSIYYGTPFERFRRRILNKFPALKVPTSYSWRPSNQKTNPEHIFDIEKSNLKAGQAIHRLLMVLFSDFYRPYTIVDLFDRVFSGAFYSYGVSEQRVHQLLTRTRNWLEDENIPLLINSDHNRVRLQEESCAVIVRLEGAGEEQDYFRLNAIRLAVGDSFSVAEAAPLFDFSRRTLNLLLTQAVKDGFLTRSGEGKKTRYTFTQRHPLPNKAA